MTIAAPDVAELRQRIQDVRDLPSPAERRALREALGLSTGDVAATVPCTRQAIRSWEAGTRTPRGAMRRRYVEVLRALAREAHGAAAIGPPEAA
jgi:DNA-binding transcriptional regulator YiaG